MVVRLASTVIAALVALRCAGPLRAQSKPAFDVASIRINIKMAEEAGTLKPSPGGLTITNYPLKGLVSQAYGLRDDMISCPVWLGTTNYDIAARHPREPRLTL